MSDANVISAETRDRAGKGAARAVRRAGRVPAVIYGDTKDPVMISLEPRELRKQLDTGSFFAVVYSVDIDGSGSERVLPRDVQFHPVNGRALHVDFLRVTKATRTNVNVPCVFVNEEESPGIKRGGLLNIVRHEVEVVCGVDDIPEQFEFDLTGLTATSRSPPSPPRSSRKRRRKSKAKRAKRARKARKAKRARKARKAKRSPRRNRKHSFQVAPARSPARPPTAYDTVGWPGGGAGWRRFHVSG
jgi:large subunit ribosomal protein L25